MMTEIPIEAAHGKTLSGHAFSRSIAQAALVFTDGTFTTIGINFGWGERGDERLENKKLDLFDFDDSDILRLGIATPLELQQLREADIAAREAKRDAEILAQHRLMRQKQFGL